MFQSFFNHIKRLAVLAVLAVVPVAMLAQGWPANYGGVMLQGFYWDSYYDTQWTRLTSQADELSQSFSLIWVPQSGNCGGNSMGYDPLYYFNQNSAFGTEAQLRTMISTFKAKNTGIIADVVVNHRKNLSNWVNFPSETYNGVTYQMKSTDIVADDDGGATKTWAKKNGYTLSSNNDEGEGWEGMRDLDHKSTNVQKCVKAYTDYLLNDLGYTGFRYDMTRGFAASRVATFNSACGVQYSVGENWDGVASNLQTWIDACKSGGVRQSATFDFNFRYAVRDAINKANGWRNLDVPALVANNTYNRYAVTFVENHDTQDRGEVTGYEKDPIKKDTLAANAFLLAMPGTPCVFLPHWKSYKNDIKTLIAMRKLVGITNQSQATKHDGGSSLNFGVFSVTGTAGKDMAIVVGPAAAKAEVATIAALSSRTEVVNGYHYRVFLSNNCETAWADKYGGEYQEPFDVMLTAVTADADAQLVYTLDGTTPTASSDILESGTRLHIATTCTLTAGLLKNGAVSGLISHHYNLVNEGKTKITVYVNVDSAEWKNVNYWSWGGDGTHAPDNGNWPGDRVTKKVKVGDRKWYAKSFYMSGPSDYVDFVFSTGGGSPQSENVTGTKTDAFYAITGELNDDDMHIVENVTDEYVGLSIEDDDSGQLVIPDSARYLNNHVFAYFVKPDEWTKVSCWAWNAQGNLYTTWPGGTCTRVATDKDGNEVYLWDLGVNPAKVPTMLLFNNAGSPQTDDFEFVNAGYYTIDGLYAVVEPKPEVQGDVNGDGIVSGADVTALYNCLLIGTEAAGNADVNGDGVVSGADVTALYTLLLQ